MKFITAVLRSLYIFAVSSIESDSVLDGEYLKCCSPSAMKMPALAKLFMLSSIARLSICSIRLASAAFMVPLLVFNNISRSSCQTDRMCRLMNSFELVEMSVVTKSPLTSL